MISILEKNRVFDRRREKNCHMVVFFYFYFYIIHCGIFVDVVAVVDDAGCGGSGGVRKLSKPS